MRKGCAQYLLRYKLKRLAWAYPFYTYIRMTSETFPHTFLLTVVRACTTCTNLTVESDATLTLGDKSYFKPYKVGQWHIVYSTLYYLPKVSFFWDTSQGMSIFKESSHQKQPSNCGRPHRLANQRPFFLAGNHSFLASVSEPFLNFLAHSVYLSGNSELKQLNFSTNTHHLASLPMF